jgi:hypothetical protein
MTATHAPSAATGESINGGGPTPADGRSFRLDVLTARQVCELPDPDENQQVCGPLLVREQRFVIGAHTGHGKTSFALQLTRAVVTGESFLGWEGCGGKALVIDVEQGLRTIKRRLQEAGLDDSDLVDYVRVPDGLELNCNPSHIAEVERILATGQYVLVHMDPFYKLHVGDSNAEREVTDLMRQLDAWRSEYRFALSLAGHCRKPPTGSKFTMHEFFGSSAYLRGAETVVGLQRLSDGYSRLHFFKDRDGDGPPIDTHWRLIFDREDGFRRDPSDGAPKRNAKSAVHDLLTQGGVMTEDELVSASRYAIRTVRGALKEMGAVSNAGKHNRKYWSLPGDEALEKDDECPF